MNNVSLVGRLARDPEVRYSQGANATCVARYTLAVQRQFKVEGQPDADFISCVAFGKAGEFAEKYLRKGMNIGVTGRIQTGSYKNKDGATVYTTDVIVQTQEFCEKKGDTAGSTGAASAPKSNNNKATTPNDGFMNIPDGVDEELPFN